MFLHNNESAYARFVVDRIEELEGKATKDYIELGKVTGAVYEWQTLMAELWAITQPAIDTVFTTKCGILYA